MSLYTPFEEHLYGLFRVEREHKRPCVQFDELNVLFHVGGKHKSPYV
jgi:hypothetical protein